jgi:threonine/homoserine/homoserine lactone efflux protein
MAKTTSLVFGIVFVLVAVLGMIGTPLVGAGEGALFHTNTAHDVIHLVVGLVFLAIALFAVDKAVLALKVVGVVYLLVAVLGFAMASPLLGFIEVNSADNWLHVVLGVVILGLGLAAAKKEVAPTV